MIPRVRRDLSRYRGVMAGGSDSAVRVRVPHLDRDEVCRDSHLRHPRARWIMELVDRGVVERGSGRLLEATVDPETYRVVLPDPEGGWIPGEEDWLDAV